MAKDSFDFDSYFDEATATKETKQTTPETAKPMPTPKADGGSFSHDKYFDENNPTVKPAKPTVTTPKSTSTTPQPNVYHPRVS